MFLPFRSAFVLLWLLVGPVLAGRDGRPGCEVSVIASMAVEAQRSAIEGIRAALAPSSCEVHILDVSQPKGEGGKLLFAPATRLIIGVGTEAARLVESERPELPVIYAMVLRRSREWEPQGRRTPPVTIPLEISLSSLLSRLQELFPGKTRLGIILNPAAGGVSVTQWETRARQMGFSVRIAECAGAGP